jgi:hypothetical protein
MAHTPLDDENTSRPKTRTLHIPGRQTFGLSEFGYTVPDGPAIPIEYLVRVSSYDLNATVIAPLQEDISMRVESRWESFLPISALAKVNVLAQAGSQGERSIISRATSRRVWLGTSPIVISLKLKFEAVSDPFLEVVEPIRLLQSMAVPSDPRSRTGGKPAGSKILDKIPGLHPPGPTPFVWDNLLSNQTHYPSLSPNDLEASSKNGDFILIEIGSFLTFWNVIVRENSVNYKIKFDPSGTPISAETVVVFETYEMPTVESLLDAYSPGSNSERSI